MRGCAVRAAALGRRHRIRERAFGALCDDLWVGEGRKWPTQPPTASWAERLLDQLEEWLYWSWPRIVDSLGDDEYLWEPTDGCWSIRPGPHGGFVMDREQPTPNPSPVTTIAWRLCHIGSGVLANRNAKLFGAPAWDDAGDGYPGTAADALAWVAEGLERWRSGVRGLSDERLLQPVGPAGRSDADRSVAWLVMHIHREVIHHGAEICLLRDLYRQR